MENKTMTAGKNAFRKEVRADGTYEVLDGGNYLPSVEIKGQPCLRCVLDGEKIDCKGIEIGEEETECYYCGKSESVTDMHNVSDTSSFDNICVDCAIEKGIIEDEGGDF